MLSIQEKREFKQIIKNNSHEIYVVSFEEMEAIIKSSPNGSKETVQATWGEIKGKVGLGANYTASADDAFKMAKLVGDLGGIGAKAYIKNYSGKPHIILKGHAGLRRTLTGTRYGIKNPKVISMGLGKAGAISAVKQGGIITIVLLTAYRVVDYFLTDQATLSKLVGTLATDIVKVGIATSASIGAAIMAGGMTTIAIGPILAVLLIGIGVSMLLDYTDNQLGITNRVIAGLDELDENTEKFITQKKRQVLNATGKVIDRAIDSAQSIMIDWVRSTLKQYLSPSRRGW